MCKELARNLFGSEDFLVKLDMSEYSSEAAVFKLIGAPAGHVGYEDGGLLTNAVRKKPFSVVLFDELEKAHDKVRKCLLQILESGQITDSKGSVVSFASAFIVATTNLGRDELLSGDKKQTIGFASERMESHSTNEINREILEELSPELTNRFQGVIPFMPIEKVNLKRIVFMEATKILNAFAERIESNFVLSDLLIDHIVDRMDYQAELGARQVARYVQEMIEDPLLDRFYLGEMHQGRKYTISVESNEIQLTDLTA